MNIILIFHELTSLLFKVKILLLLMKSLLNILYPQSGESDADGPDIDKKNTVISYLLTRILTGEYLPGEHLNEFQITKQTGVSNIPIRQAIERLIHLNLVERIPHKGVFLKTISQTELKDVYDLRIQIETYAIGQLARRITDEQLSRLNQILAVLQEPYDAIRKFKAIYGQDHHSQPLGNFQQISVEENINKGVISDLQFHLLLIHFTGNRDLEQIGELLLPKSFSVGRYTRYYTLHPEFMQFIDNALQEKALTQFPMPVTHGQINQALNDRNAEHAAGLMKRHLEFAYECHKARIELFEKSPMNCIIVNGRSPAARQDLRDGIHVSVKS
jgi:DNA-binding GntR family transcriptional regulator